MLAIFERYFGQIKAARGEADVLALLKTLAADFKFASAFVVEYERPTTGKNLLIDTDPERAAWWLSFHPLEIDTMAPAVRARLDSEPLVQLDRSRLAGRPAEAVAALERHGMAELTLIPMRNDGRLVGNVGFSGVRALTAAESTALQLIAINIFAHLRSLRHVAFHPTIGALTAREKEVLSLSAQGLTSQQIAGKLGLSPRTVNQHVDNVADKLGTRNRAHTVAEVIRHGLLS